MKAGIYHVQFESSIGGRGDGLVVLKDGTINGGDPGYTYVGKFERHGADITGNLLINRWTKNDESVFGDLPNFKLAIFGRFSGNDMTFSAEGRAPVEGAPSILIIGKKVFDAV